MPIISAVGKRRPTSTTTIRSSYSTTVMFLPISPSPPRGRTRNGPLNVDPGSSRDSHEEPALLQHRADRRGLALVGLDVGQPRLADTVAEQVQRGLDRDRRRRDAERREDRQQALVDRRALAWLLGPPAHLRPGDVAGPQDAAPARPHG